MATHSHSVRNAATAKETTFNLADDSLNWQRKDESGSIPFSNVVEVNLIDYAGIGGMHQQCTVKTPAGESFKIRSHHFAGVGTFEDRTDSFAPFVAALCEAVSRHRSTARFTRGQTGIWIAWVIVLILATVVGIGAAIAGFAGVLPIGPALGAFATLIFGWVLGLRSMRMSKPSSFDPSSPPV